MRGRIRSIKPDVLADTELWDLEQETGLPLFRAFTGLWMYADREGRFEWAPRKLKPLILPYWEGDFSRVLDALATRAFVVRYASGDREYGFVRTFLKHQVVNNRETPSELPAPPHDLMSSVTSTRAPRVSVACATPLTPAPVEGNGNGNGREGKGNDASARVAELAIHAPGSLAAENPIATGVNLATLTSDRLTALGLKRWDAMGHLHDLLWVATQPLIELERVVVSVHADEWARENLARITPRHLRAHWPRYLDPPKPRSGGGPAPVSAEFDESQNPEWAR